MTWGGGKPHPVGDRGQRYEVTYCDPESDEPSKRRVFGWSDTMAGAEGMMNSIELHPVWALPVIRDRGEPCIDCDASGRYPTGATCKSCGGSGRVLDGSTRNA